MAKKNLIYTASFFAYTIQGMVTVSLGLLMPHMMASFSMDYTQGGSMIFFMLLGGVIASAFAGVLVNRLGEKTLIFLGALCIIAGYSIMIFTNNINIIYLLLYVVGTGTGIFNIALNSVVANVSNNDHKKINMLHTFYAVGALWMTLFAAAITYYHLPWKLFLYMVISFTVLCIILFSKVTVAHHEEKIESKNNNFSFFKRPYFYIFLTLMFFYVGSEIAINGWIVTFLNEKSIVSNAASNYVLTILWALVILGRYINRHIKKSITLESRIMVCSLVIMASYLFLINTSSIVGLVISVIVLGLSMSAFYPNIIANTSEKIKDNATALGLIMSFGGLGGAVVPWINGVIADGYGLKVGMMAVSVAIGFLIIASAANIIFKKKNTAV